MDDLSFRLGDHRRYPCLLNIMPSSSDNPYSSPSETGAQQQTAKQNPSWKLSVILVFASLPLWLFMCIVLPGNYGGTRAAPTNYLFPPIALVGTSFAIHWLLRRSAHPVGLSILLSPILLLSALIVVYLSGE